MISVKIGNYGKIEIDDTDLKNIDKSSLQKTFLNTKKVPDVIRYYVKFNNGRAMVKEKLNNDFPCSNFFDQTIPNNVEKSIVLIIESPHINEYDEHFNPIAPAQGDTGTRLDKHLASLMQKVYLLYTNKTLLDNKIYPIIIANAIQWQTSLASLYIKHKPLDHKLKNSICKLIWGLKHYPYDFIQRISKYKPIIVINSCTKIVPLKNDISKIYTGKYSQVALYETSHPSAWNKPDQRDIIRKLTFQ